MTLWLNLAQQPGRVTFDTKLDLQFAPGAFLERSLSLWNGDAALGGLQNQASGYLFPMGPIFWLGDAVNIPMWVWQRLWAAAVMLLAYEGARRLARHWGGIGPWGAIVAGLSYMLAPRVLTTVGGLSGETLPAAILPWTVLPLALYLNGQWSARLALTVSAATIPFMGGQNATLVAACLILPALLLLGAERLPLTRRVRDVSLWGGLVLVVSAWWLVPLFLLGGYAPPFLDFIESARNTASSTSWLASLRGANDWVAFFPEGGNLGWVGGYELAASPLILATSALVAGAGLVGLLLPAVPHRRALGISVLVGLAVLTAGSGAWEGSPFSVWWLDQLDAALAPLRNVHKFDPIVRLPLALGLGALVTAVPTVWAPRRLSRPVPARGIVVAVATAAIIAAAIPAIGGSLRPTGGIEDLPTGWRNAAAYLEEQQGPVRAMVLPGSGFAVQLWGRTIDEPLQVLDSPPFLARAQVTVAPGGTLRLLDDIEGSVSRARSQDSMTAAFRRLGITHVLIRNDLDPRDTDAPGPAVVDAGVRQTPDLRRVASFGPLSDGSHEIEVLALSPTADPRVDIANSSEVMRVSGGPEAIDELVAADILRVDQPAVLVDSGEPADVVTDTNQRVERNFGRVHATTSAVMTAQDRYREARREHDYVDPHVPTVQTTAIYWGADDIRASTSGGYADVLGPVRPAEHPYAAFDQSIYTAWTPAPLEEAEGQWIEARFGTSKSLEKLSLTFDHFAGAVVQSVRIRTQSGEVEADVPVSGVLRDVRLPPGDAAWIRITLDKVVDSPQQVRLADVSWEGTRIRRALQLPGRVDAGTTVHLGAEQPRRACITTSRGVSCDQRRQFDTPETPGFDRVLSVVESANWDVHGKVVATSGQSLEGLFASLDPRRVRILASSTYGSDPAVLPAHAIDGMAETSWFASPLDPDPSLVLQWKGEREITSIAASLQPGHPGALPKTIAVQPVGGAGKSQLVATEGPSAGELEAPIRAQRIRLSFPGFDKDEGVGISDLRIGGLESIMGGQGLDSPTGTVCGFGPSVRAGGRVIATKVVGTLADVINGNELDIESCEDQPVQVSAGQQRLQVTNPSGFAVTHLWLTPPETDPTTALGESAADGPRATVESWGSTARAVNVVTDDAAILSTSESANAGWVATLDGKRLNPLVVDGWKQAWQVPASSSGVVSLKYTPQTGFVVAIWVGLLLAGLVVVVAAVLLLRPRVPGLSVRLAAPDVPRRWSFFGQGLGLLCLGAVSLPLALGAVIGRFASRLRISTLAGASLVMLGVAAWVTIFRGSVITPPLAANVLTALVVGAVLGRVLTRGGSRPTTDEGAS